jgi:site-specific recombinase XerD
MTPAGMRSLFRHHRRVSQTAPANPHRFRHTFASDMVRAGISLPALMQLMGYAHIATTMVYVQISPRKTTLLICSSQNPVTGTRKSPPQGYWNAAILVAAKLGSSRS